MPRIERSSRSTLLAGLLYGSAVLAEAPPPLVFTGEVQDRSAQALITPQSNSSPVVLRKFVAQGERVRAGDVVLSIDGGEAASQIRQKRSGRTQALARASKEVVELEVQAIDAERALRKAVATLAKAEIDAAIPAAHLARIDFDRYQGALTAAGRERVAAERAWVDAQAAVQRRSEDRDLELGLLDEQIAYWESRLDSAQVRATTDGVVVHGFDPWRGNRYDEGSSSYPGQRVGEVIAEGARMELQVVGWLHEVDAARLAPDAVVSLDFDSVPGNSVEARVTRISGAPQVRAEWGDGRYRQVDIELPNGFEVPVLPGASVRIASGASPARATGSTPDRIKSGRFDGEIVALDTAGIAPPALEDIWMLTLTQLAPDGSTVKEGDVVAAFDAGDLQRKLQEKQGLRAEKRTQRERLQLELAERERAERVATAEQRAALDVAERKATQPAALYSANDYRKLVIEKTLAQAELAIVDRREILAARQRVAELALVQAELDLLEEEVQSLTEGLQALMVRAPRAGVVLHLSNWQGEKFDVGSQVFRGMPVAQIPDLSSLAVRIQVPERRLGEIRTGQRLQVHVEGSRSATLGAVVSDIGRAVRSRSKVNPVPVVDVQLTLDTLPAGLVLKPGQPVRAEALNGAASGTPATTVAGAR